MKKESSMYSPRPRTPGSVASALALLLVVASITAACSSSSDPGSGTLSVSGTANGWHFHNGQNVTVSMGANSIFPPNVRINILQCADPGGTTVNLPTQFSDCDGNTIQPLSLIPSKDGSFSYSNYTIYSVPNSALGEAKSGTPVCDSTHYCVLFVTQDQNDFSKPKIFSHPFLVAPDGAKGLS